MSQTNITTASREWFSRPDDQRYLSMEELSAAVGLRKTQSWTATPAARDLRVLPTTSNDLTVTVYDPTHGEERQLTPSNWSFAQLCGYGKAPASYLRALPAELAAINLQWGLENNPQRDGALVLGHTNGSNTLRSITSESYGRIWDSQVCSAVMKANQDGRWQIPAASYATTNPRRATTLYASDRDVFIFLVDPKNPVTFKGPSGKEEQLFRGFYAWNSEVGAAVFGLATFLYRFVCDNRIIWGAEQFSEIRVRHTSGAPERFAYEGARFLRRYSEESTAATVHQISAAQAAEIPLNKGKGDTVESWLQARGFTKAQAAASVQTATAEEGQAKTVWDIVQGITAYSRSVSHTNDRVDLETKAGKLLSAVGK